MRYWFGALIAFALALVQASSIQQFRLLGVAPNLMFVLLACWLVVRGLEDALPMIAVAGITLGLIGLQTPGLVLLALLPLAVLGVARELHIVHSEFVLALLLVATASLAYEGVLLLAVLVSGGVLDIGTAWTRDILPATVVNVALTPPMFLLMRLARPQQPRRRLAY
ncbi:MAG: hypothetical protein HYX50_00975 [Chloroflexi bacterium]|nr:hypothetical protein [Chloroflexota bacterium]